MDHLNDNLFCAMFVKLNGLNSERGSIIDLAIMPMNRQLKWSDKFPQLQLYIKPGVFKGYSEKDTHRIIDPFSCSQGEYENARKTGVEQLDAAEKLYEWFRQLNLRNYKKVVPLTYNYPVIYAQLVRTFGFETTNQIFSFQFRDILSIACYENDRSGYAIKDYKFPKVDIQYIFNIAQVIETQPHSARNIARCIRDAYVSTLEGNLR